MEMENKLDVKSSDSEIITEKIIRFLEERPEEIKEFFTFFLKSIDEHSDLSMADYKDFLNLICDYVPTEILPKYKELYAKVLVARRKKIVEHDLSKELILVKTKTLVRIDSEFDTIEESSYSTENYLKIKKARNIAKKKVNALSMNSAFKAEAEDIYTHFLKKKKRINTKKQKRKLIYSLIISAIGLIGFLTGFLCIGAIPKVEYVAIEKYNDKNSEHTIPLQNKNCMVATKITGLYLPFHFPLKELKIDKEHNGKPVSYVGRYAFEGASITSVTLPSNLWGIEEGAFQNCDYLEHIHSESIDGVQEDTMPLDLAFINDYAFKNCPKLFKFTLNNKIDYVGEQVFDGCNSSFMIYFNGSSAILPSTLRGNIFKVYCKYYRITISTPSYESSVFVETGEPFELKVPESRIGYRFDGYYHQSVKITNSLGKSLNNYNYYQDIRVSAVYTPIAFTITYNEIDLLTVGYNTSYMIPIPEEPAGQGIFKGWYTIVDGQEQMLTTDKGMSLRPYDFLENIRVYAKYQTSFRAILTDYKEVVVSFDSQGGTMISPQVLSKDNPRLFYLAPEKEGMIFAGWYRDSACTIPFSFDEEILEDCTLYADWISPMDSNYILYTNKTIEKVNGANIYYFSYVPLVSQVIAIHYTGSEGRIYLYDSEWKELDKKYYYDSGSNYYSVTANSIYYIYILTDSDVTFDISVEGYEYPSGNENQYVGTPYIVEYGKYTCIPFEEINGYRFVGWYSDADLTMQVTDELGNTLLPWQFTEDKKLYPKYS